MEDLDRRLEDERPDVLEALKSMNWEERLEKARARREAVLARKAASSKRPAIRGKEAANLAGRPDPVVLAPVSPTDMPPQIDERVLRGQTPAVSPGLPQRETAGRREEQGAAAAIVVEEAPLEPAERPAPAATRSLASRIGSGFGFGLGIGASLVLGAVILTRMYPGLLPAASGPSAAPQPPASVYSPVPPVAAQAVAAWQPVSIPEAPSASRVPLAGPAPVASADPWDGGSAVGPPIPVAILSRAPAAGGAELVAPETGGLAPATLVAFRPAVAGAGLTEARATHDAPPAAVIFSSGPAPATVSPAPVLAAVSPDEGTAATSPVRRYLAPDARREAQRPGEPDLAREVGPPGVDIRPPEAGPVIPGAERVRVFLSAPSTLSDGAVEGIANGIADAGIALGEVREVGFDEIEDFSSVLTGIWPMPPGEIARRHVVALATASWTGIRRSAASARVSWRPSAF